VYRHKSLECYLQDAASGTPTPGGGSVAALVGALATTMFSMSANFTIGMEGYTQYDSQLKQILADCDRCRETLLSLLEEDIAAYNKVSSAYRLPISTEYEKTMRSQAIQEAILGATEVPLRTTMCCLYVLELTSKLVGISNPNLVSEVGAACFLAEAALQCAKLTADLNLISLKNKSLVEKIRHELNNAETKARMFSRIITERVRGEIGKYLN